MDEHSREWMSVAIVTTDEIGGHVGSDEVMISAVVVFNSYDIHHRAF